MKLAINVKDNEYGRALAAALSLELRGCEIELGTDDFDCEITEQEIRPLSEICAEIERRFPGSWGKLSGNENCKITCFSAANGGSGVSSAARVFARQKARLDGFRVFCLCTSKLAFLSDEDAYGVKSVRSDGCNPVFDMDSEEVLDLLRKASAENDEIVLDVPFDHPFSRTLFGLSDRIVVVFPPQRVCRENEFLLERLRKIYGEYGIRVTDFRPGFDEFSFSGEDAEIHGEFGAEVRKLAEYLQQSD